MDGGVAPQDWRKSPAFRALRKEVVAVLVRRVGGQANTFRESGFQIATAIQASRTQGTLLFSGGQTVTWNPDCKRAHAALAELMTVLPRILAKSEEQLKGLLDRFPGITSHPSIGWAQEQNINLATFLTAVVTMSNAFPEPTQKTTATRSSWHQAARVYTNFIDADLRAAGLPLPTRLSNASGIVPAVRDLLAMAGLNVTDDTVRKAL